MSKYNELDNQIVEILKKNVSPVPVFDLWLSLRDQVSDITVIDRRLQRLKVTHGVINIRGQGWGICA